MLAQRYNSGKINKENPAPRSMLVKMNNCWAEIVHAEVMPHSSNPSGLRQYITKMKRTSLAYQYGEIDWNEVIINQEEDWWQYNDNKKSKSNSAMRTAYEYDEDKKRARQESLQRMMQAQQQSLQPKTINCTPSNWGSFNCTQW